LKKLIVFDLDGTLAESKSSLDSEMAGLLNALLGIVKVSVISGGNWSQFEKQVLVNVTHAERLKNLSLLPTCGTKFYRYESKWKLLYSEGFTGDEKKKWDPDFIKRKRIKTILDKLIPEFSVRLGGATSIDITKPGIDKAYGIRKLRDIPGIGIPEMIFIGDAVFPGGNDYPAEEAGVFSIEVKDPHETKRVIEAIVACLEVCS
jgi:hypothetical protein